MKRLCAVLVFAGFSLSLAPIGRADGGEDFTKKCANCHGKDGKGKTKMGEKLKIKDLTSEEVQKMSDDEITKQIEDGYKDKETGKEKMPAYKGKLSADAVKDLVKVVRGLKGK